eukprot:1194505-Prorocentrum_minimum.AAC.4
MYTTGEFNFLQLFAETTCPRRALASWRRIQLPPTICGDHMSASSPSLMAERTTSTQLRVQRRPSTPFRVPIILDNRSSE